MKLGKNQAKIGHTEERVRELAGHVFNEEEIAVCVASSKLTEEQIIMAARFRVRRLKEGLSPRIDPMMQARVSNLFKDLALGIVTKSC